MNTGKAVGLISWILSLIVAAVLVLVISTIVYLRKPEIFYAKAVEANRWQPKTLEKDLPEGRKGRLIKFGYLLTSESAKWMGPMVKNPDMRFSGNNLACKNCHLDVGTRPGSASWVGVVDRFPQFRGRENKMGTIEERVNGCMERSMNGSALPVESHQMRAIVAYMEWLGEDLPEEREKEFKGFGKIKIPETAASPVLGKAVYETECQLCHGENGQGIWLTDSTKGYLYPPLWGKDTYNHGAGMHRVLTAAQFIKGNMPWGQATVENPKLTDEESYHVAAYINSFERPMKENTDDDFPDRKLKPVSTPYGPWEDHFSAEEHKYGPFGPMVDFYQSKYSMTKTK
ncbi:MAG: c-type cytochrome [Cyclobacteriaceae bacterium]